MSLNHEQVFRSVATMIAIDGLIGAQEFRFLRNLQAQLQISKEVFDSAAANIKEGKGALYIPESRSDRQALLKMLIQAACADETITAQERKMLEAAAAKMNIAPSELERLIQEEISARQRQQAAAPLDAQRPPRTCPKCGYQAHSSDDPLVVGANGDGECPACGIVVVQYLKMQHQPTGAYRAPDASTPSIAEFVAATCQKDEFHDKFELENPHLLEVNLQGKVWAKAGAMIAYTGNITFTREGVLEHGVGKMFKKAVTGEGAALMKMEGQGRVYLADRGKKIAILNLGGETIYVNGNDLLALEDTVEWDISMLKKIGGMLAGGLFNVKLSGQGLIVLTTHYEPVTLNVSPGKPVFTDPNATVAWSGSLTPEINTDISFKTLLGRGSGESIQLKFSGNGWVILQPFEEVYHA
jgi:uncharacterized protein (AIM24 family)